MVKVIDNYVLQNIIGKGQFGEVYLGFHKETKEKVAVKLMKRDKISGKYQELLENEIKAMLKCNSNPNIIQLFDIKKTTNNIYLIMEYCNGGDLQNIVE